MPSGVGSYVTNGIGAVSERNGVPVSGDAWSAGSNASRIASPQRQGVAAVVHLVEDDERARPRRERPVQGRPAPRPARR